jgi:hypothetical protein
LAQQRILHCLRIEFDPDHGVTTRR